MKIRIIIAFCIISIALLSCKGKPKNNGMPEKLIIALFGGDNPGQLKSKVEPFRKYLSAKLHTEVEFLFTSDYAAVIQAIRSKKVHMAELTPFAYVIATQKPGLKPLVILGMNGSPSLYHSVIIADPKKGIKTIEDLKKHAKELTLSFGDPASTSGHLIPRNYLISIGLDPGNKAFKEMMFSGNHTATIMNVASGKVDIGCSNLDLSMELLLRQGIIKKEAVVVLWISAPIINNAIVIRDDISNTVSEQIKNIYLNLAKDAPDVFQSMNSTYYPNAEEMSYVPAQDSSYDSLRKIAGSIKDLNFTK